MCDSDKMVCNDVRQQCEEASCDSVVIAATEQNDNCGHPAAGYVVIVMSLIL